MPVPAWFDEARFGMFVHWGHSSQQGIELSWPLVGPSFALPESRPVPVEQYHSSAATFDPKAFDASALARTAKRAGMQYAVLTTKHHDGYAMFDTKSSDFGVMHSPYGRDIVRQFVDAMRSEDIRVGLYFSLIDWAHADYPAFTQDDVPYKFPFGKRLDPERWTRFVDIMFEQVRELLSNYGRIDLIWFDGGWERSVDQWRAKDLEAMIRQLQPAIVINDRLPGCGDYATPEQFVPAHASDGPWEACMTMNESWGYNPSDTRYKSARHLVHTLCEIAGKGGKLLLNVSPRGDGTLPPEQIERLDAVTTWMQRHAESIIDTQPGLEPWQFYGPSTRARHSARPARHSVRPPSHSERSEESSPAGTQRSGQRARRGAASPTARHSERSEESSPAGNQTPDDSAQTEEAAAPAGETVYLHLLMRPYDTITVRGIRIKRVRRVIALTTDEDLKFHTRCSIIDQFANPDPNGELTITVPESAIDDLATVIKLELAAAAPKR